MKNKEEDVNVLDWSEAYPKDEYQDDELTFDGLIDSVDDSFSTIYCNYTEDYKQYDYIFVHGVYFVIHVMRFEDITSVNLTEL